MDALNLHRWKVHLVELASKLNDLGFDSVVRLPPGRQPSLEIFVPPRLTDGRQKRRDEMAAHVQTGRTRLQSRNRSKRIAKETR